MKKFSIVAIVLVLSIVFTGCTNNELDLYKAFNKSQDINSMESDTVLNFTLKGEGFSAEDEQIVQQLVNTLNNSEISIKQKMKQNEEKTAAKAFADMNLNFGGMKMPMSVWVDTDMSGETPKLVEIIEMPQMLMSGMSPEAADKKYLVYDFEKITDTSGTGIDYDELMKFSKDFQPKITNFFKDYQEDFKPEVEVVKYRGQKTVNGEALSIYELKLNDESFKDFIKYTVNYTLDNKDAIEFVKEYMNAVIDMVEIPEGEEQPSQEEINMEMDNLEKELPELKKQFNEFMDTYKDIKIIGDKGIVIEYGVNSDGYIVYEAGNIDLRIDLEAITKAVKEDLPPVEGVLNLGIKFETKVSNINKDIRVYIPKVNKSNSIDFSEMMQSYEIDQPIEMEEPVVK
ncbi:hypothetical protein [Clostridium sp. Cult1]|uniref:hypothetical protein n=1 Tax=Clostridium sp. Cult1 TaxID=2079002 RepID=UPI001F16B480|nr:hypothetical protein [Clostridium sp. Cult1]MCF6462408.1 hypothetical protein [Clostridium sp. Cult1]